MMDLNDVKAIRTADAHDMLGHVADLPQQLIDGWAAAEAIDLPVSFREIDRVVLAGMGGLADGGALFASLVAAECRLPISVVRITARWLAIGLRSRIGLALPAKSCSHASSTKL